MEKRLVEIWSRLAKIHTNLYLAVTPQTLDALLARPDLRDLPALYHRVIKLNTGSGRHREILRALIALAFRVPRGATVHYLLYAPPLIDRLLGHRVIVSWVANYTPSLGRALSKNKVWLSAKVSFFSAHWLDVLNPNVAADLRRKFAFTNKISVTTGGSFVDFDHFRPAEQKFDEIVFLGRTEANKNALAFVQAIPIIAASLSAAGRSAKFLIYGAPADQESKISRLLESQSYREISIERGYTSNPSSILSTAKVFVSLQVPSNYPSKALIEAMSCGCIPVINESGESRLMADDSVARYIPAIFTIEQLAKAVVDLLLMNEEEFSERSIAVRKQAIERFCMIRQVQYFSALWRLDIAPESELI
jgi:glycosyltransferase involved in cell wall biosynthesis